MDKKKILDALLPVLETLSEKLVPNTKIQLYKVVASGVDICLESLDKLKNKINTTPNRIDNDCFELGLSIMEAIADRIKNKVEELRK